jgi:hypothetical protein
MTELIRGWRPGAGGWADIKFPVPPMPESLSRDWENRGLGIKTPVPSLQPPAPNSLYDFPNDTETYIETRYEREVEVALGGAR